jgi:adenosine deaminase
LLREGLSLSFNTDGRGLTQTCLAEEFGIIQHAFGWQKEELYQCQLNAMEAAFCEGQLIKILLKKLEQAYAPIVL